MTTGRPIDHVVLAVDDLDAAARRWEALGFTLTPRAAHEDRMGTTNRLAQLAERNFVELLEVDRPDRLAPHDFRATPPLFSFGAHNRAFLGHGSGMSMLVFATGDAQADVESFRRAGLDTYAPFSFERQATLPDGSQVTVGFTLAFATSPLLPGLAVFACENRAPEHFWKPAFQAHANGATGIAAVYLAAAEPDAHAPFLGGLFGGAVTPVDGGIAVACGPQAEIRVLVPAAIRALAPDAPLGDTPSFAGIALRTTGGPRPVTPAAEAGGLFLDWWPA